MSFLLNKVVLSILGIIILLFSVGLFIDDKDVVQDIALQTQQETENSKIDIKIKNGEPFVETGQKITETQDYPVIKVVDGDTLSVNIDGNTQTLRLIGIDTPETVHPSKPVECFGIEASNKAKQVLNGQSVRIEQDSTQGDYDKYNRLLVYVFLKDGTNFNKLMIEEGYGYEYTYDLPYKYQSEFKQAEEQAKVLKKGLWADNACQNTDTTPEATQIDTTSKTTPSQNECEYNAYNCKDFTTQMEAQTTFEYCGGINNDIHRLDRDKDGVVCESLP